jgi:hypothetical protein
MQPSVHAPYEWLSEENTSQDLEEQMVEARVKLERLGSMPSTSSIAAFYDVPPDLKNNMQEGDTIFSYMADAPIKYL